MRPHKLQCATSLLQKRGQRARTLLQKRRQHVHTWVHTHEAIDVCAYIYIYNYVVCLRGCVWVGATRLVGSLHCGVFSAKESFENRAVLPKRSRNLERLHVAATLEIVRRDSTQHIKETGIEGACTLLPSLLQKRPSTLPSLLQKRLKHIAATIYQIHQKRPSTLPSLLQKRLTHIAATLYQIHQKRPSTLPSLLQKRLSTLLPPYNKSMIGGRELARCHLFCKRDIAHCHVFWERDSAYCYGVATIIRLLKMIGLFCRTQSLL